MITRFFISLFLSCLLASASLHAQATPSPAPAVSSSAVLSYKITLTDLLRVDIYQEDDLRTMSRVDAKGKIRKT